eukprot:362905-Chlamydomonas_euryale.AAC.5
MRRQNFRTDLEERGGGCGMELHGAAWGCMGKHCAPSHRVWLHMLARGCMEAHGAAWGLNHVAG